MRKSTKGALAAGAATTLLLGGAGSLAYWTAQANVDGGTINSGHLTLTDSTTGGCGTAPWTIDGAEDPANATFDPATDTVVPGDVLTKTCTFTLGAVGTHLRATVGVTSSAATGDLASDLTVGSTFTDAGGTPVAQVTDANDGQTLTARITVTFNSSATGNMDAEAVLNALTVTLTQVHA